MFGMTFGNESPVRKEQLDNEGLIEALVDVGIISGPNAITPEDTTAIKNRIAVIKGKLTMSDATAAVLAYVDRMLKVQQDLGNQGALAELMSNVSPDIVSSLVDIRLADNDEFLGTVLTLADQKYLSGSYVAFSDALIEAVKEREAAIREGSTVTLDGQDNVIQQTDRENQ